MEVFLTPMLGSDHLKKAVRDAQKKQKPVADEQRELFLQLAYWVSSSILKIGKETKI